MQEIFKNSEENFELTDDQIDLVQGGISVKTLARIVSTAAEILKDWDGGYGSRMDSMGKL